MLIDINAIRTDPRCQSRTGIDPGLVHEYAEHLREGAVLPPLSTIVIGDEHYLYDGFHRLTAYREAGATTVEVNAEPGDIWDAIERSCAVNNTHGKRRASVDKHRAVETMLTVMEHKGESWSNREIARRCAVSSRFVDNLVSANGAQIQRPTLVVRNGTAFKMDTSNIGKASRAASVLTDVRTRINAEFAELKAISESFEGRSTPPPPATTSLPVDDADDWEEEEVEEFPASTPEQCQAPEPPTGMHGISAASAILALLELPTTDIGEAGYHLHEMSRDFETFMAAYPEIVETMGRVVRRAMRRYEQEGRAAS